MRPMERDYVFNTLPQGELFKAKAQYLVKPLDGPLASTHFRTMGDTSSIVMNRTIEESEVYSNETPRKDLAVLSVNKAEPGLTAAFRQMTPFLKALMFMSFGENSNQLAAVDHKIDFADVKPGDVVKLDHRDISAIEVTTTGNGGAEYLIGLHFQIDASAGRLEVLAHPGGGILPADISVTYDADAITDGETYGLMDKTDMRAAVLIRQNNTWGPSYEHEYWNVQHRVDGDSNLSADGDDFGELTVKGRIFADPLKPSMYRYGRVRRVSGASR